MDPTPPAQRRPTKGGFQVKHLSTAQAHPPLFRSSHGLPSERWWRWRVDPRAGRALGHDQQERRPGRRHGQGGASRRTARTPQRRAEQRLCALRPCAAQCPALARACSSAELALPAPLASPQGGLKDITNKNPPAYQKKISTLFEEAGSKEPVDKADLADVGNAQAMIPYLADIQRHYRESEVRERPPPPFASHAAWRLPAAWCCCRLLLPACSFFEGRTLSRPRRGAHDAGMAGRKPAHVERPRAACRSATLARATRKGHCPPRALTLAPPFAWAPSACFFLAEHQPRVGDLHAEADRHQREDARHLD